ncbi:hypothetical protein [Lentzea sp. NPDC004782]|uniref:hypothetical protein n=1 Tax=Lentzea sp. NPDC004782 TaxID=3154458 RepID=UPI00339E2793
MAADTLTTVAAFTAAFFSLGGAATSAIIASRTQKSQWKRTTTVEKVAKFLDHLDLIIVKMHELSKVTAEYELRLHQGETGETEARARQSAAHDEVTDLDNMLLARISELELVVGSKSVEAAFKIRGIVRSATWTARPAGGANNKSGMIVQYLEGMTEARNELVRSVRNDLGLPANKFSKEIERHQW